MARKAFLLRIPESLYQELEAWAQDELRSVNGQIEFLLRDAVRRRSTLRRAAAADEEPAEELASEQDDPAKDL